MIPYHSESNTPPSRESCGNIFARSGKGVVDVSHAVNNAFSIVKRLQQGATTSRQSTDSKCTRNLLSGRISRPWGSDATLAVAPRTVVIPQ